MVWVQNRRWRNRTRCLKEAEPWLSELSELSDQLSELSETVGNVGNCRALSGYCRALSGYCRVTIRSSAVGCCRATVGQLSGNCRATVGLLSGNCRATVGQLSGCCRATVERAAGTLCAPVRASLLHGLYVACGMTWEVSAGTVGAAGAADLLGAHAWHLRAPMTVIRCVGGVNKRVHSSVVRDTDSCGPTRVSRVA